MREPILSHLHLLYLVLFLDMMGVGLIVPLFTTVAKSLNMSPTGFGILSSSFAFAQLVFSPVIGSLSDTYGRKHLLLLSISGTALSYYLLTTAKQLWVVYVSRIIVGVVKQTVTLVRASVGDMSDVSFSSDTAFANVLMIVSGAFVIGPAISSLIGLEVSSYLSIFIFVVDFLLVLFFLPNDRPKRSIQPDINIEKSSMWALTKKKLLQEYRNCKKIYAEQNASSMLRGRLVHALVTAMKRSTYALILLDVYGLPKDKLGFVVSFQGIVGVLTGIVMNIVTKFFSKRQIYFLSSAVLFVVSILTAFTQTLPEYLMTIPFANLSSSVLGTVCISAYSGVFVPAKPDSTEKKTAGIGLAMGVWGSFDSIGGVLGPMVGGLVFQYGGMPALYIVCGLLSAWASFIGRDAI